MKNITWEVECLGMENGGCGPSSIVEGRLRGLIEGPIPFVMFSDMRMAVENALNGASIQPKVEKVIFNNPATIILWTDGTKTVVKCQPGDIYSKEVGFITAYLKKLLGNDNTFNKEITKWVPEETPWEYFKNHTLFDAVKFSIPEDDMKAIVDELKLAEVPVSRCEYVPKNQFTALFNIDEMHNVPNTTCELCEDGDEELMKKTIRRTARCKSSRFKYCPACGRKLIKTED